MTVNKLTLCIIFTLSASVYATGFIGPPMTGVEAGKWDFSIEYGSSSEDLDSLALSGLKYNSISEGDGTAKSFTTTFTGFDVTQYGVAASYGLSKDWQVSVKAGMASAEADSNGVSLDFGNNIVYGIGTKFNYYEVDDTIWGVSIQCDLMNADYSRDGDSGSFVRDSTTYNYSDSFTHEIDFYDLIVAIGPTLDTGGIRAYGGLYFHAITGDFDETKYRALTQPGNPGYSGYERYEVSGDLEVSSNVGAFLGIQLLFVGETNVKAEVQVSPDSFGFALGGGYAF